jgi:uncharacterized protein
MEDRDVQVVHDVLIPTRDGSRLAANLYRPRDAGPVPAIAVYMPYLKDGHGGRGMIEVGQLQFARRGYACLTIDTRGFGASEGLPQPPFSEPEARDGQDALAWIAEQPWCDGRTALWGISYSGDTSLSVAARRPPSLAAIVPIHATDDEFTGVLYPHGCRGGIWAENDWGFRMLGLQLLPPLRLGDDRRWARLWRDRLDRLEPWMFLWHTIPPATWATWRADVAAIRVPTYAVSAWHDCYPGETLRAFNAIDAPKRALIGPWKHEFPDRAVNHPIGLFAEMGRWWDHWLKGVDTGLMAEPPVAIFEQPNHGWRYLDRWPPSRAPLRDYFLHPDGTFAPEPPPDGGADAYVVDPTVGLARLPWDWTTPTSPVPLDVTPDDHRALPYTSAPLTSPLTIAGDPELTLYLASDQPDFPLTVWLSDVSPNGFATLICQGWTRPSQQVGESLRPGQTYELRVSLSPTCYRVPAGHRLRLVIGGASFPALVGPPTNPRLTVFRSSTHPSRLRLPIADGSIPSDRLPTFPPPTAENPAASLHSKGEDTVGRDLLDRSATYRKHRLATYRLEGGTLLTMELTSDATIDRDAPGNLRLSGVQTITLDRPTNTIVARSEVLETYDHLRIIAAITIDSRDFYHRAWDLDLRHAEWNWRTSLE